jgi:hypothetical protein
MGKGVRNMAKVFATWEKGVRNIRNTLLNIMIRQQICFLIRIMWLGRCPMLAPRSDVRPLAVPYFIYTSNYARALQRAENITRLILVYPSCALTSPY